MIWYDPNGIPMDTACDCYVNWTKGQSSVARPSCTGGYCSCNPGAMYRAQTPNATPPANYQTQVMLASILDSVAGYPCRLHPQHLWAPRPSPLVAPPFNAPPANYPGSAWPARSAYGSTAVALAGLPPPTDPTIKRLSRFGYRYGSTQMLEAYQKHLRDVEDETRAAKK